MAIKREKLRWNGWGWAEKTYELGASAEQLWSWIGENLGMKALPRTPAKPLDEVSFPDPGLPHLMLDELRIIVGPSQVKVDKFERAFHAMGQSYHDLLRLRAGWIEAVPDVVVYPRSAEETVAVLQLAERENVAVIPFGGGSSVVGGVNAAKQKDQNGIIVLDTTLLDKLVDIDPISRKAKIQAGIYGPELEEQLQAKGWTLGHYPQSFEFSTLGGWIAARGAGQQSNLYGKAEHWLAGARLATPRGLWSTEDYPASAAGPDLRQLVAGSEGVLGVIVDAEVKIHPLPPMKDYRGYLFKNFESGVNCVRRLVQEGVNVATLRLSDVDETKFQSKFSGFGKEKSVVEQLFKQYLAWRGYTDTPCVMLIGLEGSSSDVVHALGRCRRITTEEGGTSLGTSPGENWYAHRFEMPYLRDPMMDRGIGVDTLETATHWANVPTLHQEVTKALRDAVEVAGDKGIVMCHISHAYEDGCSLYFTYVFPIEPKDPIGQWRRIKNAASDALSKFHGTISHHHGVGEDHRPWMEAEKNAIGIEILRAAKKQVDPKNLLNPGKLLPNKK